MTAPQTAPSRAAAVVRRWIVFAILFALVCIAANGISGLLHRALSAGEALTGGTSTLGIWLAYALIGGPLAVLLWWFSWRRMSDADRGSVAWGLYVGAMYLTSLIVFSTALLSVLSAAVRGRWEPWSAGTALTWFALWLAHRWLLRHPTKSPTRLATVALALGALWGVGVASAGAIRTITRVVDESLTLGPSLGAGWWPSAVQGLIWAVGGGVIWWWHWRHEGVGRLRTDFADGAVAVTVLVAAAVSLSGLGTVLFVALRALFDQGAGWTAILSPLPAAVAFAGVGTVIWLFHLRDLIARGAGAREAGRLIESGVGLVGFASGIGVVINAALASLRPPLVGSDARELLFAGLAALIVGAIVWFRTWHPLHVDAEAGAPARRIYLIAVFGVSAVVALGALLFIGTRVFQTILGQGEDLLENVRAPLGLLVATALVAGYHFAVWRRDRALAPPLAAPTRAIDQVVLVAAGDTGAVAAEIHAATGAEVVVWTRTDAASAPDPKAAVAALTNITARRVLLLGDDDGMRAVPLAD